MPEATILRAESTTTAGKLTTGQVSLLISGLTPGDKNVVSTPQTNDWLVWKYSRPLNGFEIAWLLSMTSMKLDQLHAMTSGIVVRPNSYATVQSVGWPI